jgi:hypothetical protein
MTGARAVAAGLLVVALAAGPAAAHHTGVYVPKDNAITTNFKQLKFSVEAGKFDVARQLFDKGALRREMRTRAVTLPAGLESRLSGALLSQDAAEVERTLMIFFAALGRDLALEAERQLATGADPVATGSKFLEAIWRYYNLVDFAVGRRDARASVAMRLAYDDAEAVVRPATTPPAASGPPVREAFRRIAEILSGVIEIPAAPGR